jgi:competence protein ComEA
MNSKTLSTKLLSAAVGGLFSISAWAGFPVNINSADAVEIAQALDGIGQSKAEAIVAYRDANGPFATKEQLTSVRGIGLATLEKNFENIMLENGQAN